MGIPDLSLRKSLKNSVTHVGLANELPAPSDFFRSSVQRWLAMGGGEEHLRTPDTLGRWKS